MKIKHDLEIPGVIYILLGISLVWRILLGLSIGAGFDEAYYYCYSIHPALSYFDHPPFVSFLAGFFPLITGMTHYFTIRLGAILLFSCSSLIFYLLARRFVSQKSAISAFILFNLTPLFMLISGVMILPDAGLLFFWVCSLFFLSEIFIYQKNCYRNWLFAGVFTGLAMLSKYHGGLLGIGVIVFLLVLDRKQYLTFKPYFYALTAFLVFSPVLIWNFQHRFISFAFQGGRAVGTHISFNRFFQALSGQAGFLTPFIFIPLLIYVVILIKKMFTDHQKRIYFFYFSFGILPLLIIFYISFFKTILPHWTLPCYVILLIPFGSRVNQLYKQKKLIRILSQFTIVFIISLLIVIILHSNFGILQLDKLAQKGWISQRDVRMDPTLDTYGWKTIDQYIEQKELEEEPVLISHKWFLCGEINLATRGRYSVLCFNHKDPRGFGLWNKNSHYKGKNAFFIYTNRYRTDPVKSFSEYFESIEPVDSVVVKRNGIPVKTIYFHRCNHLLKEFPSAYQEYLNQ